MKTGFVVIGLALAAICFAPQDDAKEDAERMRQIWSGVSNRTTDEIDAWYKSGDFPRAAAGLQVSSAIFPSDYEVHDLLGWMLGNLHRYDEEMASYVRFMKANPNNGDAAYLLANFYFQPPRRQYGAVAQILAPAMELPEKPQANAYRLLAHSYAREGFLVDALRIWDAYLLLRPDDEAAQRNRNNVFNRLQGK